MSRTAFTLKFYSFYPLVLGVCLIVIPNQLLSLFHMPLTTEVWIRVVGILVFNIGVYYWYAAQSEAPMFFYASVFTRFFVLIGFSIFVVLDLVDPILILFGIGDFAGALWTLHALKQDKKNVTQVVIRSL